MPVRVIITARTVADCSKADYLLADRGYDTDKVIEQALIAGMEAVIPRRRIEKSNENMITIYLKIVIKLKKVFSSKKTGEK